MYHHNWRPEIQADVYKLKDYDQVNPDCLRCEVTPEFIESLEKIVEFVNLKRDTYVFLYGKLTKEESVMSDLNTKDISSEAFREYDFGGRVYRIENPKSLIIRTGGSTHRIVDSNNLVHCVPAPGFEGCVLRWKAKEGQKSVSF